VQNPQAISVIYSKQGETGVVKKPFETKILLATLVVLIVIEINSLHQLSTTYIDNKKIIMMCNNLLYV